MYTYYVSQSLASNHINKHFTYLIDESIYLRIMIMATFVPHIVFFWVEYSVQSRILLELDKSGIDTPSIVNFIKKEQETHLIQLQWKTILFPKMRVHYIKHSLYWIQIKLFLYSNNRSEQTTKFVLHCLVAALGSRNNKNSKILKRSNELYVEKRMRLSKHIQPEN